MKYDPMTGFPLWLPAELRFRRWISVRDLPKVEKGHCRWCGQAVPVGRRSWCSQECVDAFMIRSNGNSVVAKLRERDREVCAVCGIDTAWLAAEFRRLVRIRPRHAEHYTFASHFGPFDIWGRRVFWDADHILPVVQGGGCCGLENYRTLCCRCHKAETAALAARRAEARALESGRGVQLTMEAFR